MNTRRFPLNATTLALAAGLSLAAPQIAGAQCSIYRLDVPDFDQRRDPAPGIQGLPGNGNCYCVPTSVMNWFAYIANHGYPEVLDGPANWQSNTMYEDVTEYLDELGSLMGTDDGVDPNPCGTNGDEFVAGATSWLESRSPGNFVVYAVGPQGTNVVTPQELYAQQAFGALVALCYSRWNFVPPNFPIMGYPARYVRQPVGHCVTLTRVYDACDPVPRLWYRDPAGFDGPDTNQAQFVTQYSDMIPTPFFYAGTNVSAPIFRTMWRFEDIASNISMLDSMWCITPVHGLTASAHLGEVSMVNMWHPDTLTTLPRQTHQIPGATGVLDLRMAPRPGMACAIVQMREGIELVRLNLGAPGVPPVVTHLRTLNTPGPMAFDSHGRLMLATDQGVWRLDVGGPTAIVQDTLTLARTPVDLVVDPRTRDVVLLFASIPGGAGASVGSIDDGFLDPFMDEPLPPYCQVGPNSTIAVDPRDGAIFIATPGVNAIYRLVRDAAGGFTGGNIAPSTLVGPRNLRVLDGGRVAGTSTGGTFVLTFNGQTSGWVYDTGHPLHGLAAGDLFDFSVSAVAYDDVIDPLVIENIEDLTDSGPGVPDCYADFNNDGAVSAQDIFDFLAAFFSGDSAADVNLSGTVTAQDIFDFLAAFFRGCGER